MTFNQTNTNLAAQRVGLYSPMNQRCRAPARVHAAPGGKGSIQTFAERFDVNQGSPPTDSLSEPA